MSKKETKTFLSIILIVMFSLVAMGIVDAVISPQYFIKSAIKIVFFLLVAIAYLLLTKNEHLKSIFIIRKRDLLFSLLFGICVYIFILAAFFITRNVFDFSNVTKSLTGSVGVTKDNFIYVAIYISFINSLLEEFFFRGFAFLILQKYANKRFAYLFSSLAFGLYHVAIMENWFNIGLFALLIVSLVLAGCMFNYIDDKTKSIFPSWIVHMFANFSINTVGFILFLS